MNAAMTAQLVPEALMMAIWRHGKPHALLHHSDHDGQYTNEQFQTLMADNGVASSMGRSGNVWDDAAMQSLLSSLRTKRTVRKVYHARNQARANVVDNIELFQNLQRRHFTMGYSRPVEFERIAAAS